MNNTKKSKFQQRLDDASKKYLPEDPGQHVTQQVNLHNEDPDYVKRYSIKDMDAIILSIEDKIIPGNEMPLIGNDAHLGYNTAIRECVTYLKTINRTTKFKQGT